jgi:predicted dehydrogenase
MSDKQLGVGIIGMGNISRAHGVAYKCLPELARLVAVADIDPGRARAAKDKYGCRNAYQDHRDLLGRDDIDVVSVCTQAQDHASVVIDALKAGKHVLCEKPIAHTLAAADSIIAVAEGNPKVLMSTVYQIRSDPACARTRRMIQRGHLGAVVLGTASARFMRSPGYYASSPGRGTWKTDGGGVVINQAIHQLDLLVAMLGEPVEVASLTGTFIQPIETEDTAAALIKFESGAFATFECTVCAHRELFAVEVLAENASVTIAKESDWQHCSWHLHSNSASVARALRSSGERECPSFADGPGRKTLLVQKVMCKLRHKEWLPPHHWGHTPHVREFLEAVRSGGPAPVPPREARQSLELAYAVYLSAMTGKRVSLPLNEGSPVYNGVSAGLFAEAKAGTAC